MSIYVIRTSMILEDSSSHEGLNQTLEVIGVSEMMEVYCNLLFLDLIFPII